jgi:pyruvate dehydrogenase (quinone)
MALAERGVSHLTVSKDVQMMKLAADKRSMRNPGVRTSSSWSPPLPMPPAEQLRSAAEILNSGSRVAVLAGQGALSARDERSWAKRYCPMTAPILSAQSAASL